MHIHHAPNSSATDDVEHRIDVLVLDSNIGGSRGTQANQVHADTPARMANFNGSLHSSINITHHININININIIDICRQQQHTKPNISSQPNIEPTDTSATNRTPTLSYPLTWHNTALHCTLALIAS
jgi:hypothetical protein